MDVPSPLSPVALSADGEAKTLRLYWQSTAAAVVASAAGLLQPRGGCILVVAKTGTLDARRAVPGTLSAVVYVRCRSCVWPVLLPHLDSLQYTAYDESGAGAGFTVRVSRTLFKAFDRVVTTFLPLLQRVVSAACADPRFVDRDIRDLLQAPGASVDVTSGTVLPRASGTRTGGAQSAAAGAVAALALAPYALALDGSGALVIICRSGSEFPPAPGSGATRGGGRRAAESGATTPARPSERYHAGAVAEGDAEAPLESQLLARARGAGPGSPISLSGLAAAVARDGPEISELVPGPPGFAARLPEWVRAPAPSQRAAARGAAVPDAAEGRSWVDAVEGVEFAPLQASTAALPSSVSARAGGGRAAGRGWLACCWQGEPPASVQRPAMHVVQISLRPEQGVVVATSPSLGLAAAVVTDGDLFALLHTVLRRAGVVDDALRVEWGVHVPSRAAASLALLRARNERVDFDRFVRETEADSGRSAPAWLLSAARLAASPDFSLQREAIEWSLAQPVQLPQGASRDAAEAHPPQSSRRRSDASLGAAGSAAVLALQSSTPRAAAEPAASAVVVAAASSSPLPQPLPRGGVPPLAAFRDLPREAPLPADAAVVPAAVTALPSARTPVDLSTVILPEALQLQAMHFVITRLSSAAAAAASHGRRNSVDPHAACGSSPLRSLACPSCAPDTLLRLTVETALAFKRPAAAAEDDDDEGEGDMPAIVVVVQGLIVFVLSRVRDAVQQFVVGSQAVGRGSLLSPASSRAADACPQLPLTGFDAGHEAAVLSALRACLALAPGAGGAAEDAARPPAAAPSPLESAAADTVLAPAREALAALVCIAALGSPFVTPVPVPVHEGGRGDGLGLSGAMSVAEVAGVLLLDTAARTCADALPQQQQQPAAVDWEAVACEVVSAAALLHVVGAAVSKAAAAAPSPPQQQGHDGGDDDAALTALRPSAARRPQRHSSTNGAPTGRSYVALSARGGAAGDVASGLALTSAALLLHSFPSLLATLGPPASAAATERERGSMLRSAPPSGLDSAAAAAAGGYAGTAPPSPATARDAPSGSVPPAPPRLTIPPPPARPPPASRSESLPAPTSVPPINLGMLQPAPPARLAAAVHGGSLDDSYDARPGMLRPHSGGELGPVWAYPDGRTHRALPPALVEWAGAWPRPLAGLVGTLLGWAAGLCHVLEEGPSGSPGASAATSRGGDSAAFGSAPATGRGVRINFSGGGALVRSVAAASAAVLAHVTATTWVALYLRPRDSPPPSDVHRLGCALCHPASASVAARSLRAASSYAWSLFRGGGGGGDARSMPTPELYAAHLRALNGDAGDGVLRPGADAPSSGALSGAALGSPDAARRLAPLLGLMLSLASAGYLAPSADEASVLPPAALCVLPDDVDALLKEVALMMRLPRLHLTYAPSSVAAAAPASQTPRTHPRNTPRSQQHPAEPLQRLEVANAGLQLATVLAWGRGMQDTAGDDSGVLRAGLRAVIVWHRLVAIQQPAVLCQLFPAGAAREGPWSPSPAALVSSLLGLVPAPHERVGAALARLGVGLLRSAIVRMPGEKSLLLLADSPQPLFPPAKQLLGLPAFVLAQRWLMHAQLDALVPCVAVADALRQRHHHGHGSSGTHLSRHVRSTSAPSPAPAASFIRDRAPAVATTGRLSPLDPLAVLLTPDQQHELGERLQATELAISACGRGYDEPDPRFAQSSSPRTAAASRSMDAGRSTAFSQATLAHVLVSCGLHLQLTRLLSLEARARETWLRLQEEDEEEMEMEEEEAGNTTDDAGAPLGLTDAAVPVLTDGVAALSVDDRSDGGSQRGGALSAHDSDDDDDDFLAPALPAAAVVRVAVDPVTGMPLNQQTRVIELQPKPSSFALAALAHAAHTHTVPTASGVASDVRAPLPVIAEPLSRSEVSPRSSASSSDESDDRSLDDVAEHVRVEHTGQAQLAGAFAEEADEDDSDDDDAFFVADLPLYVSSGAGRVEIDPVTGMPLQRLTRVISVSPAPVPAPAPAPFAAEAVTPSAPPPVQSSRDSVPGRTPGLPLSSLGPISGRRPDTSSRSSSRTGGAGEGPGALALSMPKRAPSLALSAASDDAASATGKSVPSLFLPKSTKKGGFPGFSLGIDKSQSLGGPPTAEHSAGGRSRAPSTVSTRAPLLALTAASRRLPPVVLRMGSPAASPPSLSLRPPLASPAIGESPPKTPMLSLGAARRGRSLSVCALPTGSPLTSEFRKGRSGEDHAAAAAAATAAFAAAGAGSGAAPLRRHSSAMPGTLRTLAAAAAAEAASPARFPDDEELDGAAINASPADDSQRQQHLLFEDGEYGAPTVRPLQLPPRDEEALAAATTARSESLTSRVVPRPAVAADDGTLALLPSARVAMSVVVMAPPQQQQQLVEPLGSPPALVAWTETDTLAVAVVPLPRVAAAAASAEATAAAVGGRVSSLASPAALHMKPSRRRLMLAAVVEQVSATSPSPGGPGSSRSQLSGRSESLHPSLQRAPTFLLQRLTQGQGAVKQLSYLDARAASPLYADNELHARVIMLLFSCMLTQEGTALRDAVVMHDTRSLSAHALHRAPSGLDVGASDSWGEGMFEGFIASARSAQGSGRTAAVPTDASPVGTAGPLGSRRRSMVGPMREADRDENSATLQRFMSGKSFRAAGASLRRLVSRAPSAFSNSPMVAAAAAPPLSTPGSSASLIGGRYKSLHQQAMASLLDGSGPAVAASPWEALEAHPVYALQCHLNHPGNLVLVNVQLRRLCIARGRAYMRLLRMLSLEFFVPAQYELQGHIASGAYGSVMAAFAARDSPAAARLATLSSIARNAAVAFAAATAAVSAAAAVAASSASSMRPSPVDHPAGSGRASGHAALLRQSLLLSTRSLQLISSPDRAAAAAPGSAASNGGAGDSRASFLSDSAGLASSSPPAKSWQRAPSGVPGAPSPGGSPAISATEDSLSLGDVPGFAMTSAVAAAAAGGAPTAMALRLALPPAEDGIGPRKSAAGEVQVAVKVMTFPEDPLERCALSDILTEVAIMDDVTALFLQASAAAARAQAQSQGGSVHAGGEAGGLSSEQASSGHRPLSVAMSRYNSTGGASDGGAGLGGGGRSSSSSVLHPGDGCPAVCLLDFGITTGACWLVQERCAMSLRQWRVEKFSAVQGTLSARLPLLLDVFSCVLHRLAALHALGITHYDVKCDNVLLREGWPAALADYAELQHQQQLAGGGRRPASSPPQSSHSSRSTQAQPAPVAAATGMVSRVGSGFAPNTSGSGNGSGGGGSLSRAAAALLPYVCLADFGESDFAPHVHASTRHFVPGRGTECIKAPEQLRAAHSRPQAPPPPTESSAAHALSSVDVAAADGTPGAPPPGASVSAACGAPSAAAVPQHASGHHWSPGTACDIWSAGCLLYELLTGAFLFDSEDWARFFVTVTGAPPSSSPTQGSSPVADLPLLSEAAVETLREQTSDAAADALQHLLASVLQRSPQQRPTALAALDLVQDAAAQLFAVGLQ